MRIRALFSAAFVLVALPLAFAQEGHPLRGTWHGNWGADGKQRTDVTLVMDWDGKEVTGILNPGLRSSPLQKAVLDAPNLMFHFEVDVKDRTGGVSHAVVDAKIEDLTNMHRKLVGTWTQGGVKGDFKATRDN
jgi:hypothetical protein